MIETTSGFFQKLFDIFHRLFGLSFGVIETNEISVKICADLSTQIKRVSGAYHLTQIIIQILIRISVFGVEFSDSLVCHQMFLFKFSSLFPTIRRHYGQNPAARKNRNCYRLHSDAQKAETAQTTEKSNDVRHNRN